VLGSWLRLAASISPWPRLIRHSGFLLPPILTASLSSPPIRVRVSVRDRVRILTVSLSSPLYSALNVRIQAEPPLNPSPPRGSSMPPSPPSRVRVRVRVRRPLHESASPHLQASTLTPLAGIAPCLASESPLPASDYG